MATFSSVMSSLQSNDLQPPYVNLTEHLWDVVEQEILHSQRRLQSLQHVNNLIIILNLSFIKFTFLKP